MDSGNNINATDTARTSEQGWLETRMKGFYDWRAIVKAHPVWGTLFACAMLVLGVVGSEAIARIKVKMLGPDEFLAQMAESQKQEFADLKGMLGSLRSSIAADNRSALADVERAVSSIEEANSSLLQQLAHAKRENETLSALASQKGNVAGGYDFILTERSGLRIDATTIIGIKSIAADGIHYNLTSSSSAGGSGGYLGVGQSTSYRAADGRKCGLSVLNVRPGGGGRGTVSFAVICE